MLILSTTILAITNRTCSSLKDAYRGAECCADPSGPAAISDAEVYSRIDRTLLDNEFVAAVFYEDDERTYYKTFNGVDMDKDLIWSASVDKSVFSALVGSAVEYDDFQVDMPLSQCLPPEWIDGNVLEHATFEDLISMRSGMVNEGMSPLFPFLPDSVYTLAESFPPILQFANFDAANVLLMYQLGDPSTILPEGFPEIVETLNNLSRVGNASVQLLYDGEGNPMQHRIDDPSRDKTHVDRFKRYDPSKPNFPTYTTHGYVLASICMQNVLNKTTQLEFEAWARERLYEPLGYPQARITGDGSHYIAGTTLHAPGNFYIELMRMFLNDGVHNSRRIMNAQYTSEFFNKTNYERFDDGWYYFRGVWGEVLDLPGMSEVAFAYQGDGEDEFAIGFRGFGGNHIVGSNNRMFGSVRRSFSSAKFDAAVLDLTEPVIEYSPFDPAINTQGTAGAATAIPNSAGTLGSYCGEFLPPPLYKSSFSHTHQWWHDITRY